MIDQNYFNVHIYDLSPNVAYNNSDNTNRRFFSVSQQKSFSFPSDVNYFCSLYFQLNNRYEVYVPYIDYQPIENSNRRNLASGDKNIMSTHYFIFYLIAQIGGFFAFFVLFCGPKIKSINELNLMYEVINEYNEMIGNEIQSEDHEVNPIQDSNCKPELVTQKSKLNKSRNVPLQEENPLMDQNNNSLDQQNSNELIF